MRFGNNLHDQQIADVFGVPFDIMSFGQVADAALAAPSEPRLFLTCNLNHLRTLQKNAKFRHAYGLASIITVDSRTLQALAKLKGGVILPLVTGADLFADLIDRLRPELDRPFFLTSSQQVGESLTVYLKVRGFKSSSVQYYSPPFGFQKDYDHSFELIKAIQGMKATHIFMGVGAPKSELWVAEHYHLLPAANIFCVGAALDFAAGDKSRAPLWVRRLGFEWMHRLLSEPKRLVPRYAGDAAFLLKVISSRSLAQITRSRSQ